MKTVRREIGPDLAGVRGWAVYSPCERYRYELGRSWGEGPRMVWVMLNPSTATESVLDPTVRGCVDRAMRAGCGSMVVVNLFALRATDPIALYREAEPVGPENDAHLVAACRAADRVVVAWGVHGAHLDRAASVLRQLRAAGVRLECLKVNQGGSPGHPLYVAKATALMPFDGD